MARKIPQAAWKPGQSGNPKGRPKGARNHATRVVMALLEGEAEVITRTAIEAAKGGNMTAIRLVLERLLPPIKESPVDIELPDLTDAAGISAAQNEIVKAVAQGILTLHEGQVLAELVEGRRKAFETENLESRIVALEKRYE